jgi:hypothetical protein
MFPILTLTAAAILNDGRSTFICSTCTGPQKIFVHVVSWKVFNRTEINLNITFSFCQFHLLLFMYFQLNKFQRTFVVCNRHVRKYKIRLEYDQPT